MFATQYWGRFWEPFGWQIMEYHELERTHQDRVQLMAPHRTFFFTEERYYSTTLNKLLIRMRKVVLPTYIQQCPCWSRKTQSELPRIECRWLLNISSEGGSAFSLSSLFQCSVTCTSPSRTARSSVSPSLHLIEVPVEGSAALWCISQSSQLRHRQTCWACTPPHHPSHKGRCWTVLHWILTPCVHLQLVVLIIVCWVWPFSYSFFMFCV